MKYNRQRSEPSARLEIYQKTLQPEQDRHPEIAEGIQMILRQALYFQEENCLEEYLPSPHISFRLKSRA